MTNHEITPFLFEGESLVRVVTKNDAPWFVAADVCRILDLSNPSKAIGSLDADEVVLHTLTSGEGTPGNPNVNLVSESGLYTLIFRSRKPAAIRFRKWVTSEVLPAIRKTGEYVRTPQSEVLRPISEQVQDVALNLRIVTETRQSFGCKASQQMWFKMNLPTVPAMFEAAGQLALPFSHAAE